MSPDIKEIDVKFRSVPKRVLSAKVPNELLARIGSLAAEEGRPDNEVITRLLCLGLKIDPSVYGIETDRKRRAATAS